MDGSSITLRMILDAYEKLPKAPEIPNLLLMSSTTLEDLKVALPDQASLNDEEPTMSGIQIKTTEGLARGTVIKVFNRSMVYPYVTFSVYQQPEEPDD